ncbi:MAG: MFS transporter [Alphaproteobacteria bacterium]|nr:MFS transporter [Alphaproteobacteria bacterium]MDP6621115.1 MFS transporter [Alphaproteobacteria bacterium]
MSATDRGYAWAVAGGSLLLMVLASGGMYGIVVALKPVALDLDVPRWVPSAAYALLMFGIGLGGILFGRWSDRAGMFGPALLGTLGIGLGSLAVWASAGPVTFVLAQALLLGFLGNGALFAPLVANVTHWFDRRRGLAVAMVISGQSLGGAMWPPIFRYFIDETGWRTTYLWYGAVAVAVMLPLSLLLRRRRPVAPVTASVAGGGSERPLEFSPDLLFGLLCLAIVACCVPMAMPMVHIVSHATDLGHPTARAAEMLAVLLAFGTASRLAFGALADRIGPLKALLVASGLQALVLSFYLFVDGLAGLYLLSVLFGLSFGGIVPLYTLIIRDHFAAGESGWRIGVIMLFGTIGAGLGGWLGGFVFDLTASYQWAFVLGVIFNIGNLAIIGTLLGRERRQTAIALAA